MKRGPPPCHNFLDFVEDLTLDVEGKMKCSKRGNGTSLIKPSPHVKLTMGDNIVKVLVDTGSQITCISEEFYLKLKRLYNLNELLVSNIYVSSAIGKKTTTVKRQILFDAFIGNIRCRNVFLVVPYLTSDGILGND